MANYAHAKEIIAANVYTNHDGQVTAEKAKTAINEVVDTLIAGGYLYAGVAKLTPTQTNPGSPDANVFYIATEPGTYTNFVGAGGSLVVAEGEVAIFKFNGTWSKEVTGAATASQVTELGQNLNLSSKDCFPWFLPSVINGYFKGDGTIQNDPTFRIFTYNLRASVISSGYIYLSLGASVDYNYSIPIGRFILSDDSTSLIPSIRYTDNKGVTALKIAIPNNAVKLQVASQDGSVSVGAIMNGKIYFLVPHYETDLNDVAEKAFNAFEQSKLYKTLVPDLWDYNSYAYASSDKVEVHNSESSGAGVRVGVFDVSTSVGKQVFVDCVCKGGVYDLKHYFANDSNDIVEQFVQSDNVPTFINVPSGATKLYVNYVVSLNDTLPFVGLQGEIMDSINILDESAHFQRKELVVRYEEGKYVTISSGKVVLGNASGWKYGVVDVKEWVGNLIELNCVTKPADNTYKIGHAFADDDDNIIGTIISIKPAENSVVINVPVGATKLYVCCYEEESGEDATITIVNQSANQLAQKSANLNQWYGKKIVWLGTSIPWGQSNEGGVSHRVKYPYPSQICNALGATLVDSTRGGLSQMINYDEGTGLWYPREYGSTAATIAECQAAYAAGLIDADRSPYSFENTLLGKNADLYVFDVEPNNEADGSAEVLASFDWRLWKYTDDSSFASHRNTYIGALIYEIDALLTEKPYAIIVFIGEYIPMKLNLDYNNSYAVRTQSLALCEKFHIHYIDLASKLFYIGKNADVWLNNDMTHLNQVTYDRIAKMLINELLLIA